ncbi:hypothetical protein A2164_01335 [Candidatus Curtissbacteria bacterium RBG_13_35_7]|uniref:HD domain-containing protein n=1 Tax=Candidatus Curtissbacteria bacterium RBG_13_35_7 TaxID=1797705 RepID=A0A1F5G0B6_9BACT|nr:MAG: hypothetical protein A2164_01335 [Candidatus Curtissbacteria bacterium RBG_13_35_7]
MSTLFDYFSKQNKKPELSKEDWQVVGLLHDADYEATQKVLDKHTDKITEVLKNRGVNKLIIDAIRGHSNKAPRDTLMAKSVYICDELTGLIVACALVQPDKKLKSVKLESVLKKFKNKSFAAAVSREQIKLCEKELNIPLEKFISITLSAMQSKSTDFGL